MYGLRRTVDAATEPVTLTQAKAHLRVDGDDDDDLITGIITAARQYFEDMTNRALITQTWVLTLDRWYASDEPKRQWMWLPRAPLAAVSSVYYVDTAGTSTLWSSTNYEVDTSSEPGRLGLAYGKSWPATRDKMNAVTITYTAGETSATTVPEGIKRAVLCLVSDMYYNRETMSETGVKMSLPTERIISPWKIGDSYFEWGGVE